MPSGWRRCPLPALQDSFGWAPQALDSPQVVPIVCTPVANLLHHDGFENPVFGTFWWPRLFLPSAVLSLDDMAHGGRQALLIEAPELNDARLVYPIQLRPNARYRLSGWIKTENVEEGLGANLTVEWDGWVHSRGITGTTDHTFVSFECDSPGLRVVEVQARLGHYGQVSRGRAWFDDLRLERLR